MKRVHLHAIGWAAAGATLLLVAGALPPHWRMSALPATGWLAALAYLLVSNALLIGGLRRRGLARFGPADSVTSLRSTLVGAITGLVVASFTAVVPVALLVALIVPALALDAADGWVARRTGTSSELGARFDMEVDAFLLLVLSVYVSRGMGFWVLTIGVLRYAFLIAGWAAPSLQRRLPARYWRKVVTAAAGIALAIAASGWAPGVDTVLVGCALLLLLESFGRDVVWLARRRSARVPAPWPDPAGTR